ncbi:hypothetical protein BpHYR1_007104 [Brachionus plicatilis]|uniref:Uncharacterized protein n=1 Tax=Brachionus plicatilis TaxID=10195 RepID=A0A3M7SE91_BRAPC|nr:hypothetical protein BpHYR1_007104 [Brachionus plicatilis]
MIDRISIIFFIERIIQIINNRISNNSRLLGVTKVVTPNFELIFLNETSQCLNIIKGSAKTLHSAAKCTPLKKRFNQMPLKYSFIDKNALLHQCRDPLPNVCDRAAHKFSLNIKL